MADEHRLLEVANFIRGYGQSAAEGEVPALAETVPTWGAAQWEAFLTELTNSPPATIEGAPLRLLETALRQFYQGVQGGRLEAAESATSQALELYEKLGPNCPPRWYLLAAAARSNGERLRQFAAVYAADPPAEHQEAAAALAPLFQRADYDPADVFPALLDALAHPQAASPVLDLANFLTRNRQAAVHPALSALPRLVALLKGVSARLEALERQPIDLTQSADSQERVSDSVAIATSLCDALGLMGDERAKTALQDAMHLRHRRIRVEAAAALARLGDDDAVAVLAQLAEYPATRLRAVAFAEELGLIDHIDDACRTPTATAEAELACYLAEPQRLGAAPGDMELLDKRNVYWPSYDDPQDCFLFRFAYRFGDAGYTNVGIAGPLVHAFHVDLTQLPIDDIYAIYAGWQAEHPEIREIPADQLNEAHQAIADDIQQRLAGEGMQIEKLVALGLFLGDPAVIATARRDDVYGAIVAGLGDAAWFPHDGSSQRPIGPEEAWNIWKGRRMLAAFNDEMS